jgi:hypothetical protein
MAATAVTLGYTPEKGINYTYVTDSSADWAAVPNSTYFYDKTDKLPHYKDGTGTVLEVFSASGGSSFGQFGVADSTGAYTYYTTLQAAITAASPGQSVEFFTDYVETGAVTVTLKDGVNINGNGHFYTLNNAGTTNALQISSTGTYQIYNLTVQRIGSSTANGTQNLPIYCNSNNVTCFFTGSLFIGNGYGGSFNNVLNAVRITDGTFISFTSIGLLVYGNFASISNFAEVRNVQGISVSLTAVGLLGAGLYLVGANAYNCSGRASTGAGIYIDTVNLSSSYGFSASHSGILSGPAVQINQCYGQSYGRFGIEDGEIKNSTGYSTANIGLRSSGYIFNSVGKSTASVGLFAFGNAANCSGISTVSSGFSIYDGNTTADNCTSISTASAALLTASGIAPTTTYNNCVFDCKWNNASGHAASIQSNNVEFNNCTFLVTNAGANCLHSAAAYTVKYASNVFKGALTPVNANITQGVVNTEDNQGNILI